MRYLVDTNVVSEWLQPQPTQCVIDWLEGAAEDQVFLSVVTLAELRFGVERKARGRRRDQLSEWLHNDLPRRFEGRILRVDEAIAHAWGEIAAHSRAIGRPISTMDAFLAAFSTVHQMTLVTRNVKDFSPLDIQLLNPWEIG